MRPLRRRAALAAAGVLLAGRVMAVMPEFLIWDELRSGALVELLPGWSSKPAALHVVTPPGSVRPARVMALIDFLARRFVRAPWAHGVEDAAIRDEIAFQR